MTIIDFLKSWAILIGALLMFVIVITLVMCIVPAITVLLEIE